VKKETINGYLTPLIIAIALAISFFASHGFFDNKKSAIIRSDGLSYYSYLPALFIYGDYSEGFVKEKFPKYYEGTGIPEYMQNVDGKSVNKYFFGTAVLMYPFFITAHWLSLYFKMPADGYSIFYQYLIGLSAVFYAFIGLFYCHRLLRLYSAGNRHSFLILLLLAFGTNLFFYSVVEATMSHAYSFAAVSAFLYYSKIIFERKNKSHIIPACIALGFVILIRPFNVLILLSLPFLAGSFSGFRDGLRFLLQNWRRTFTGILFLTIIVSLQCLIWYKQTGHFIVYSYTYERFYFRSPHLFKVLFSYQKGLFVYTPLTFLALAGMIVYFRQRRFESIAFVASFMIVAYIMSCWHEWYYGDSFGFRPMIEYLPLFAILLLFTLQQLRSTMIKRIFVLLLLMTIFVNQVQSYQYKNFILHWHLMSKYKYWKVFLKTDKKWAGYVWDNPEPADLKGKLILSSYNDFESDKNGWTNTSIKEVGDEAHSGKKITVLDAENIYSNTLLVTDTMIFSASKPAVSVVGYIRGDLNMPGDLKLMISYENSGGVYYNNERIIDKLSNDKNGWKKFEVAAVLKKTEAKSDLIKVFLWNPEKNSYDIDDVEITFFDLK
jgi:hypothetical protein